MLLVCSLSSLRDTETFPSSPSSLMLATTTCLLSYYYHTTEEGTSFPTKQIEHKRAVRFFFTRNRLRFSQCMTPVSHSQYVRHYHDNESLSYSSAVYTSSVRCRHGVCSRTESAHCCTEGSKLASWLASGQLTIAPFHTPSRSGLPWFSSASAPL